jgi:hypothetical protein
VVNVAHSIRTALRAFFARPLRRRTDKTLHELVRSLCHTRVVLEVDIDGIRRNHHSTSDECVGHASAVLVYFVRDQVLLHTSLARAESHPLLSSAFHGVHANDACIHGTVFNLRTRMEQPSAILYVLDVPCDAFFIADWMPEKAESIRDVIIKVASNNYTVFR